MKKILLGAAAALVMGISGAANAEIVRLPWASVLDITVNDGSNFGGCLARLSANASSATGGACPGTNGSSYISFSCTGELQAAEVGEKLYETAQIGMLTNRQVRFHLDTNKRHNGYCVAVRADFQ